MDALTEYMRRVKAKAVYDKYAPQGQHVCSYYCDRPECIKSQRDELRDRMPAWRPMDTIPEAELVLIRFPAPDGDVYIESCLHDPDLKDGRGLASLLHSLLDLDTADADGWMPLSEWPRA